MREERRVEGGKKGAGGGREGEKARKELTLSQVMSHYVPLEQAMSHYCNNHAPLKDAGTVYMYSTCIGCVEVQYVHTCHWRPQDYKRC